MIVTEFQLDRFRGGNPLRVLDLGNGLNVALVRSAAGRAQLLNVIPTSFYGPAPFFWDGDDDASARDISGQLVLRTDQGVFRIHHDASRDERYVQSPDGTEFDASRLHDLLDGVHVKEYRDIFTFNLDRLQRLVGQGPQGIPKLVRMAQFLKSASQDTVTESETTTSQQTATVDLSSSEAALRELYQMLKREAHVTADHGPGERLPKEREKITRDLKKVDATISDAQAKIDHLEAEINETQCALAINRGKARLAALDRELAELTDIAVPSSIADVTEGSIERLEVKIAECKQQLKQLSAERDELLRQSKTLSRDDRASQRTAQIESLLLHEKSSIKEEETIERLKLKIEDLQSRLEGERLHAHDRSHDFSASLAGDGRAIQRVEALDQRLGEAERAQEIAEQRLVLAENASLRVDSALPPEASAYAAGTTRPEDAIALHEAEQRVTQLRERLGQDDHLQQLELERADMIARIRELYRDQMMPFRTIMAMGVPFMIGIAMIIYGLTQYTPTANWRMVMLGFLISAATAIIKMIIDRDRTEVLETSRGRLERINHDIESYRASDASQGATDVLREQLMAAEAELGELHARFAHAGATYEPSVAAVASGETIPVETARLQMEQAQRRLRELNAEWRDLLASLDLSPTLTPAHARQALADRAMTEQTHHSGGSELELQLAAAQNEVEIRRDWLSVVAGKLRHLLKELNVPSGGTLDEQFAALRETYTDYQDRRQTRRQLARAIKRIRQKATPLQDAGRRYVAQRKQLLSDSTHQDSQQQIQRQMRSERRKLIEQQRELVEQDLDEIRNRHGIETKTPLAEHTDEELEPRLAGQQDKLASLREKCLRQSERRGRLRAMLSLDDNESPAGIAWDHLLRQTKRVRDELVSASQQTIEVTTAITPNSGAAPQYLTRASEFLQQLSGGQFQALDLQNEDQTLIVVDHPNRTTAIDDINPNHLPNIYFSLWLTRIEAYSDRGIRLPIVMEDPLEATRASRRPTVAGLLSDFGALEHQLVLVTAEPDTARTFAHLGVPIADFSHREPVDEPVEYREVETHYPVPELPDTSPDQPPPKPRAEYDEEEYLRYAD